MQSTVVTRKRDRKEESEWIQEIWKEGRAQGCREEGYLGKAKAKAMAKLMSYRRDSCATDDISLFES